MKILVTGAAGFIGYHLAIRLLERGDTVVGLDNLNEYYSLSLKLSRLSRLQPFPKFDFVKMDLADRERIPELFRREEFEIVVHLGAQAGVRYSVDNPLTYVDSNIVGTTNILEGCRYSHVRHLVYASTSSVYGGNTDLPFSPHQPTSHPLSFYAATKKANELMAHTYSTVFGLPTTGLRFFTVYGPWGRPDMALFLFTKNILSGKPIDVFNYGHHKRDFTFIDDIVNGIEKVLDRIPTADPNWSGQTHDPATSAAPFRLYNLGNNRSVELLDYIELLERLLRKKATVNMKPMQPGDVLETHADIDDLVRDVGYLPATSIEHGMEQFVKWYVENKADRYC